LEDSPIVFSIAVCGQILTTDGTYVRCSMVLVNEKVVDMVADA
jgi:hypothetical protein